ncbi:MAG: hypothetical protein ACI4E4_01315 [Acetatifactor sp.]
MIERQDKRFVSCPVCGKILMRCQGDCSIDITCGKCNQEIVVLVDEEKIMVLEHRRSKSESGQVSVCGPKMKPARPLQKAAGCS